MNIQELLHQRRISLLKMIGETLQSSMDHSVSFVVRLLGEKVIDDLEPIIVRIEPHATSYNGIYAGYPWLAAAGYTIGANPSVSDALVSEFITVLTRVCGRANEGREALRGDDIGLLGIAEGIYHLQLEGNRKAVIEASQAWMISLLQEPCIAKTWSYRLRDLASDILDPRGRLQVHIENDNRRAQAAELVLQSIWPQFFQRSQPLTQQERESLAHFLLTSTDIPNEPEEAAVWLYCLDLLAREATAQLVHSISATVTILQNIQHGLKRWVWKDKPRRANTLPSRWQIDDEYDVQALLWTILYPLYGAALMDEIYLPTYGLIQSRADLVITSLKLIIEVKIARNPSDFVDIEEQVAGDLGLYFKDNGLFDHMIVFIYDDCDNHRPEKYDSLRNALKKRDNIEEVIIIRRPGMLPPRGHRNG